VSPTRIVAHSLKEALLAEESALGGGVGGVEAAEGGNGG